MLGDPLRPTPLDTSLIAQARSTIRQASIPKLMFNQLQRGYSDDTARALHLDVMAVGIEKVLRRRSGRRLSEPIPSFYTQKVFKEATGVHMRPLVKQLAEDYWVWVAGGLCT